MTRDDLLPRWTALTLALLLTAGCGGGGSSGGSAVPAPPPSSAPPPAPAPVQPTQAELEAASKTAAQSTFGVEYDEIVGIAQTGPQAWLDAQFDLPPTYHLPLVDELLNNYDNGAYPEITEDVVMLILSKRLAWWHRTFTAPDLVRQRVAFALSEIFVVADSTDVLNVYPAALATYYDLLLEQAFGNYRDLLEGIVLHPAMGVFLSHVNNRKADPVANTFPDENFAREVMQLFSIGLFELNADGSLQLDGAGNPVPTYDNVDIREFAKIFTGLSYGGPAAAFGRTTPDFRNPMQMFDAFHETGPKTLLNGQTVPANQSGLQDIAAAVDNLFNHPNVGPFLGRLLIQRLVTSNPSPAYIERVAATFNDNGTGVRGDLRAVIRAILLDPEAGASGGEGKLREPIVRYTHMVRAFNPSSADGFLFNYGYYLQSVLRQHPLSSPSVFNFFSPEHRPAGAIADAGLAAPEFQITTATTVVNMANVVDFAINGDFVTDAGEAFADVTLDFSEYEALGDDLDALLDRLDLVFTYGQLSDATRSAIISATEGIPETAQRARNAIYLLLISPDYAVRR
ncbi:MAG: DUF1800 domain-containing protein [Pseudomonadota bacterium]